MTNKVNAGVQPTPKLFCALFFHEVDGAYEVTAMHVAAMNGQQAEEIVNAEPEERYGAANCHRFIVTDEMMELHFVNTHTVECLERKNVMSIEQFQGWVRGQTTASESGPAVFRSF
jgi:hypothetical protein